MKKRNTPTPSAATPRPTQDEISQRARDIWLARGQPIGQDLEIWLEAERQLQGPVQPLARGLDDDDTAIVPTPRGLRKKKLGGKTLSEKVEDALPEGGYGTPGSTNVPPSS